MEGRNRASDGQSGAELIVDVVAPVEKKNVAQSSWLCVCRMWYVVCGMLYVVVVRTYVLSSKPRGGWVGPLKRLRVALFSRWCCIVV